MKSKFVIGAEPFTITTKPDNKSGKNIEVTMTISLTLSMRYYSSPDLKGYAVEMPLYYRSTKFET